MSNNNDPLVEAVARTICETQNVDGFKCTCPIPFEPDWCNGNRAKAQARAAIKAVLEWYSNWENIDDHMLFELSAADDGKTHAGMRRGVAAAMAAELKRREG